MTGNKEVMSRTTLELVLYLGHDLLCMVWDATTSELASYPGHTHQQIESGMRPPQSTSRQELVCDIVYPLLLGVHPSTEDPQH